MQGILCFLWEFKIHLLGWLLLLGSNLSPVSRLWVSRGHQVSATALWILGVVSHGEKQPKSWICFKQGSILSMLLGLLTELTLGF
jgi:hypothetical protein